MFIYIVLLLCVPTVWSSEGKCGVVDLPDSQTLIIGGQLAKRGEVPWHAGIYTKTTRPYKQICGGSVISNNIVLSAAHCFWDDETMQLPADNYAVGVGKLYRRWNTNLTKEMQQKSDVKEIHIPVRYQGNEANHQEDIAIVIVTKPFQFTSFVRPVCVDFGIYLEMKQLHPGSFGKVAGWGLTAESGPSSQALKVIKMPYVDTKTCISESPYTFRPHITSDKFCAGYKDSNLAVCQGDSGGGLAFAEPDNGEIRYYLRGIVSTAPSGDSKCNGNAYAYFTRLLKHEHFVKLHWGYDQARLKTDPDDCGPVPATLTSERTGQKAWDKCLEYQAKLVFPCVRKAPSGKFSRANRCHHYSDILFDGQSESAPNEFPHMAMLAYGNDVSELRMLCGGSLISDKFVLTTAHCTTLLNAGPVTYVVLGVLKRSDPITDSNLFRVKQIHQHPDSKGPNKYNDISLLELETTVYLDEFLVPACLHTGEDIDDGRASATGWGAKVQYGPQSNEMKKMILTKHNDSVCTDIYHPFRHMQKSVDLDTLICYEKIATSYDACQGDSGGPLQVINSKISCMHTIIGLTSSGYGCNRKGVPGLFTRVSHYLDWIEKIAWP